MIGQYHGHERYKRDVTYVVSRAVLLIAFT